ncbi:phosphoribosylanthranilate isomerase [Palleronia marisminoris]|uniref:N-(5'-phosphoribosyl)anthranilate isomerase n=1 Tax=Palleronia marisminoris TaxID=315423 RepID=A0A1Y5RXY1_9RHOB|nr:phosphoribosylanthranilate isomerase [Palleronia marisminoris]SFG42573.1 phosphoribosylanthranilate isomerase [Palleronia marisminoris]SLN27547.1 N-(5'-phosphoribosyl)anthranilate isomerase [Palleronia marisminoris]
MTPTRFKICGITDPADVPAALLAGASYLGFVFFPKSPRNLDLPSAAAMAGAVPPGIMKVALVVDPSDAALDLLTDKVPIDMLQLHGSELPERVREIKTRTGLPVMKAIGVAGPEDLPRIDEYAEVADQLLIDAKPPRDTELPGGNGLSFDWTLIAGRHWARPWMLAGGLTPENVAEAVRVTGAPQVDVSSGVERAPGVKDPDKIAAFGQAIAVG